MVKQNAIFKRFLDVTENRKKWIVDWKQRTGKKVVGCFPRSVPEEMIHAAGLLPIHLLGSDEPITAADEYLHPHMCHPIRANFDMALRGNVNFLDALVITDICDFTQRGADIWRLCSPMPSLFNLRLPTVFNNRTAESWLLHELERFRGFLEELVAHPITNDDLKNSIALWDRQRSLFQELHDLRRNAPSSVSVKEMETIVVAAMSMPREEHVRLLSDYLAIERKQDFGKVDGVKLLLWGNPCEDLEPGFAEAVEAAGGLVVEDDIDTGARYFSTPTSKGNDPIRIILSTYLKGPPCPTRFGGEGEMSDYLLQLVENSGAKGVVCIIPKYCIPFLFAYPLIKERLDKAGVNSLMLETGHSGAIAQVRTRLAAFVEMLSQR